MHPSIGGSIHEEQMPGFAIFNKNTQQDTSAAMHMSFKNKFHGTPSTVVAYTFQRWMIKLFRIIMPFQKSDYL